MWWLVMAGGLAWGAEWNILCCDPAGDFPNPDGDCKCVPGPATCPPPEVKVEYRDRIVEKPATCPPPQVKVEYRDRVVEKPATCPPPQVKIEYRDRIVEKPAECPPISGARTAGAAQSYTAKGVTFTTSYIPPGSFQMGSPTTEAGRDSDEGPAQVRLTRGYELMRTEVTQRLWTEVQGSNPSKLQDCLDCPVEWVSWLEAVTFANALSTATGLKAAYAVSGSTVELVSGSPGWRLPTEAEWEYAARAGGTTLYSGSGSADDVAWYGGTSGKSGGKTHPVGALRANAWGLHDMSGNVWEWVWDVYEAPLPGGVDPVRSAGGSGYRVYRGGSWANPAEDVRVAFRRRWPPDDRGSTLGFRLSRTVP